MSQHLGTAIALVDLGLVATSHLYLQRQINLLQAQPGAAIKTDHVQIPNLEAIHDLFQYQQNRWAAVFKEQSQAITELQSQNQEMQRSLMLLKSCVENRPILRAEMLDRGLQALESDKATTTLNLLESSSEIF